MKLLSKILLAFFLLIRLTGGVEAIDKPAYSTAPTTNNGVKWRIGYYEGGPHNNYYHYLIATVEGLMELGWIEKKIIPTINGKNNRETWSWLNKNLRSDYIEFVDDGFYTAEWDTNKRAKCRASLIQRLNTKKDIDLIIAMGTWAGKDMANNSHKTPTMVMSTSDPIGSGIIKSIEDSGYDHVHARVDPTRYERQVRIFHDLIGFKKLGVAYEDSVYGRTYAAIDPIEKVAKERGFEIVRCYTQSDIANLQKAGDSVIRCFEELAGKVDAIYVTQQGGVNTDTIDQLVMLSIQNQIPTFSQLGSAEVQKGLLLSISRGGHKHVGQFHAATFAKVFNGAKPRQLNQLFEEPPKFAINLKTAEEIGLYLYADFLAAADEIYSEIDHSH